VFAVLYPGISLLAYDTVFIYSIKILDIKTGGDMKALKTAVPFKWPFQAPKKPAQAPLEKRQGPAAPVRRAHSGGRLADVVMVIFWGASIPGLMWLGAAGGF